MKDVSNVSVSNYEKCCIDWRKKLSAVTGEALMARIPELAVRDGAYVLWHFDREFFIDQDSFVIRCPGEEEPVGVTEQLNVYTYLWHRKEGAALTGVWVPFRDVPGARPFGPAFQKSINQVFAQSFSGKMQQLIYAMEKMGGKKLPHGDVGYELLAFPGIPLQLLFWDGDEEFEAQANVLFDKSAVQFIHVESLVSIAQIALLRALKWADTEMKGCTFGME